MAGSIWLGVLLLFALALPAQASDFERITDFRQDVAVGRDGTMAVRETITVDAKGDFIEHGIYRDFPTIYRGGHDMHVRFDVQSVTLDGHDTPYSTLYTDNGTRLQMGDADAMLSHGLHTFDIHYITDRQIGFFAERDELYWNVTGNGWDFEIEHAGAVIHLPEGARIESREFFTGPTGKRGKAAAARLLSHNTIAFDTTSLLDPDSGLTIVVDFAKGAVLPPDRADRMNYFLRDNEGAAGALAGLALLCLYFVAAWWLVGRDPRRGTIVPLFAPPQGLSPAAMRYVHRMQYDRKAFAATLIGLAVKGALTIGETKHFLGPTYTLKRAGAPGEPLLPSEGMVAQALLGWDDEVELTQKNQSRIGAAIAVLKRDLSDECERVYFNQNQNWFWPGLVIIGLSCAAAALLSHNLGGAFLTFLWSGLFGVAAATFSYFAFGAWRTVITGHGAFTVNLGIALWRTLCALPFAATLIGVLFFLNDSIQPVTVCLLALEGFVALLFYHLLRAPTRAGGTLRDAIDGFALFLKTAETPRLETLQPPDMTPQLFEKFLPYAVALDSENAWSRKFETAMAAADAAGSGNARQFYVPMWYQGDAFAQLGAAGFASAIGLSIGSAAASASAAPGSGSGSGGGGFSGGGGGGGGGGGW